jgi:tetratricopeptide (TPR) repeat protein
MGRRLPPAAIAIVCGALALQLAPGCERPPDKAQLQAKLDRAEQLCLDSKYDEAQAVLKSYLLVDPQNAAAHFYLGRTYLVTDPLIAEGEYQTALRLFLSQGHVSPTKRLGADYFEMMCNLDSAKALALNLTAQLSTPDAGQTEIRDTFARAFGYVARAQEINPSAEEIKVVAGPLQELARAYSMDHR